MNEPKLEPQTKGEAAWAIRGMLVAANIAAERRAWVAFSKIREAASTLARQHGLIVLPDGTVSEASEANPARGR